CRGGVRACVVCAYLGIVTWTGWKVTITIRLLYGRYTIDASPHHGFKMPHRFWAQGKPPPSRRTMGVTSTTSEHLRPSGRPDSTIRLQAMLLLPTHDSRLSLRPITAINASADLLLNLLNRGPVLRPIPGMHRATAILRVIEVALRQRVRGGLGRLLPLPLQPILFGLSPRVLPRHAVNLDTDLLLILLSRRNSGVSEVAVYTTLAEVVPLALEEARPVLNRVA